MSSNKAQAAESSAIPEPGVPFPNLASMSPVRETASALEPPGSAPVARVICQPPTNGVFHLLNFEDTAGFEALKLCLVAEHQPVTPTEAILVDTMVESHWLAQRAQRIQNTHIHSTSGVITNEKT